MTKYNIGIIGRGFVGGAVAHGFSASTGYDAEIRIYDKDPSRSSHSLEDVVSKSDFIFVSVPTPSSRDGTIHLDILDDCISEINEAQKFAEHENIILVRSTVVPGTTRMLQEKYKDLNIVFNPEFLTERSAMFDFINQSRFVIGGEENLTTKVASLYRDRFGSATSIIETDFESAELIKYVCNVFFATKVSFLNEMKLISDEVNANWEDVIEGFLSDGRIGHSHAQVPGPDGKLGFGGSCFPKDVQALINFSKSLNIDPNVVEGVWKTNLAVRPEKDWEKLAGRATVSSDD